MPRCRPRGDIGCVTKAPTCGAFEARWRCFTPLVRFTTGVAAGHATLGSGWLDEPCGAAASPTEPRRSLPCHFTPLSGTAPGATQLRSGPARTVLAPLRHSTASCWCGCHVRRCCPSWESSGRRRGRRSETRCRRPADPPRPCRPASGPCRKASGAADTGPGPSRKAGNGRPNPAGRRRRARARRRRTAPASPAGTRSCPAEPCGLSPACRMGAATRLEVRRGRRYSDRIAPGEAHRPLRPSPAGRAGLDSLPSPRPGSSRCRSPDQPQGEAS